MSTPRSRAIRGYRNSERQITADPNLDTNKEERYAVLGTVINTAVRDACMSFQQDNGLKTFTPKSIRGKLTQRIEDAYHSFFASNPDVRNILQANQQRRYAENDQLYFSIVSALQGGAINATNTADAIVEATADAFVPEDVAHPKSSAILENLGKLHIDQFIPYRNTYLQQLRNRGAFLKQIERHVTQTEAHFIDFLPGYPLDAAVPEAAAADVALHQPDDFVLNGQSTIKLRDIPLHTPAIGCPITFDRDTTELLWVTYATLRVKLLPGY